MDVSFFLLLGAVFATAASLGVWLAAYWVATEGADAGSLARHGCLGRVGGGECECVGWGGTGGGLGQ